MRITRLMLILGAVALVASAPAMADGTGDILKITLATYAWPGHAGNGGEFLVTIDQAWDYNTGAPISDVHLGSTVMPVGSSFTTFCIEENENVSGSTRTYWAQVNTRAIKGGESVGYDDLDPETAYLYWGMRSGTLAADYPALGYTQQQSAAALQAAIWGLENEAADPTSGLAKIYYDEAMNSGWTDIGDVRVMNLWTGYNANTKEFSGLAQDLLIAVPAPGALVLGGLGLALVGWIRRRKA